MQCHGAFLADVAKINQQMREMKSEEREGMLERDNGWERKHVRERALEFIVG